MDNGLIRESMFIQTAGAIAFKAITSGCMQGEKQSSGTWFVQGRLNVPYSWGNAVVKFDALFVN